MFSLGVVASKRRRVEVAETYRAEGITTQNLSGTSPGTNLALVPPTSISDSLLFTMSCWFVFDDLGTSDRTIRLFYTRNDGSNNFFIEMVVRQANRISFRVRGSNSGFTLFDNFDSAPILLREGNWNHLLFSIDATVGRVHAYMNDTEIHNDSPVFFINNRNFMLSGPEVQFFFSTGNRFIGCLTDYWMSSTFAPDLTVDANRRLFSNSNGDPVRITDNGTLTNGERGNLFFSGGADTFLSNKGSTGGTARRIGNAIANCPSSPSD